jgi:serine/threonine protein phosphatase 1
MKHYIIGDIHGEYQLLLNLISKLPNDAKLIFVGDLINRGKESKEVIDFVKNYAFGTVRGNHEEYLLKYGTLFMELINQSKIGTPIWTYRAISSTLRSYGLLSCHSNKIIYNKESIKKLKDDMNWIASLPLYLELGQPKNYILPVVVTHGSVGKYWLFKDKFPDYFAYYALNNRNIPSSCSPIFNIYGHKSRNEVLIGENFVSLDTGCGKREYGKLSAYCLETKEVISVSKTKYINKVVA